MGEVFQGRYELLEILGRGAFATVYRAADRTMSRDVALKILTPTHGAYSENVTARFLREAQVFASLEEPHTITMYDFGQSESGLLFMVFEHVDGDDLVTVISESRASEPRVVVHVLAQLLQALREAHAHGIFHRDIKPANVLMYEYGGDPYRVKLIDFGIAKDVNPDAMSITRTGRIVGTPRYMAPELLFGQPMGADSDIFSLGLVAFELLAGRPAIAGESNRDVLEQQVSSDAIEVPEELAPPELRALLEKMMHKEREHRYRFADEVIADLRRVRRSLKRPKVERREAHTPPRSGEVATRPLAPTPARGSSRWKFAAGSVIAALVFIGGVIALRGDRAPPRPRTTAPQNVAKLLATKQDERAAVNIASPDVGSNSDVALATSPSDTSGRAGGCGKQPGWSGLDRMSATIGGRTWYAHLPRGYEPDVPHPLLLMFHRSWSGAELMLDDTLIPSLADEHGLVVFAFDSPDGIPWEGPSDSEHVLRALDHGFSELCLDRTRIYGIGDGKGGEFVQRLACITPFSAIALTGYAESDREKTCVPSTPTPRLRIYGEADLHVPSAGGAGCVPLLGTFRSAQEIDERWSEPYGCSGRPRPWGDFRGGRCRTWDCEVAPMVTCATAGGHYWPSTTPPAFDLPNCEIPPPAEYFPNREAIWKFFETEARELAPDELRLADE